MARPVRLVMASQLGSDIDGAWWPHTASVASELPELIGVLHASLGEIVDIGINWSPTEGPVDLDSIVTGARTIDRPGPRRPRLMKVEGKGACAKLLVVPYMTSPNLGAMVMRCAAGSARRTCRSRHHAVGDRSQRHGCREGRECNVGRTPAQGCRQERSRGLTKPVSPPALVPRSTHPARLRLLRPSRRSRTSPADSASR